MMIGGGCATIARFNLCGLNSIMPFQAMNYADGFYGYSNFISPTSGSPNGITQWQTYNSSPLGKTGECYNDAGSNVGVGGSYQTIGYANSTYWPNGVCRGFASGNFTYEHAYNYGDIADNQSQGHRRLGLENILCIGDSSSWLNSPNS